jgi:hypothetical protein
VTPPQAPEVTLASLPSAKTAPFTMYFNSSKTPIAFTGLPVKCPKGAVYRFAFDAKKWEAKQKEVEKQFQKLEMAQWKALSEKDLAELHKAGVDIQLKGLGDSGQIIINPMTVGTEAAKAASDSASTWSEKGDDQITTNSK